MNHLSPPGVPEHLELPAPRHRLPRQNPSPREPEPRLHGLFPDDQTTLTGLPLGVLLTVTIIAHNASGDSPESEPATITLS